MNSENDNHEHSRGAAALIGPPGSGKTTVVRGLTARGTMAVIETGNLLEEEVRQNSQLGRQIKPYKVAGSLVPSHLVKEVVAAELERVEANLVLFDGFPRSVEQVRIFEELLQQQKLKLTAVFVLSLEIDAAIQRLAGRRICEQCSAVYNVFTQPPCAEGRCDRCGGKLVQRKDDNEVVIRRRFDNYARETLPVVEHFQSDYPQLTWMEPPVKDPKEMVERIWKRLTGENVP